MGNEQPLVLLLIRMNMPPVLMSPESLPNDVNCAVA
jgi:hypothetical protein